jgi:hypothetical protein
MAIEPLQLPGPLVVPKIDWSPLDKVGDAYVENQRQQREAAALAGLVESIPTRGESPALATTPRTVPPSVSPSYPRIPGYEASTAAAGPPGGQLPRGLRNNNPGNIEDGPLAKSLPGYAGSDGRFAKFDTPENGLGAMDALLTSYGRRGLKTVNEVIGRWAPSSDNNDVSAYARFVSPNGDPNAAIDLSDPAQRKQIVGKMAIYENGMHGGIPGGAEPGTAPPAAAQPPSAAEMATAARGMTPDMKKRVQALFAVGSPTATTAGLALISKFIGKQEPIKLGEGDVLVDPDSGQIIGRAPGKSQAVREGGAIVQDGKLIYQAPDRPQTVAPGGTLVQSGKPVYQSPANAQVHEVEDPATGLKLPVVTQGSTVRPASPGEVGAAPQTGLPPEVSPKVVRTKRSEDFAANEQGATMNAKAAAEFQPLIDQAVTAYEKAAKAGGVGPIVGSAPMRYGAAILQSPLEAIGLKPTAEKARQDYDTALSGIQARIVAAQNKGEGSVSNFERAMYASQFPTLTKLDPADQIKYLKQIQAATKQTIETGGKSMLGQQPSIITERPPVGGQQPATQGTPISVKSPAEAQKLAPGTRYVTPDGNVYVR